MPVFSRGVRMCVLRCGWQRWGGRGGGGQAERTTEEEEWE